MKNFMKFAAIVALALAFVFASCRHNSDSDDTPQSAPTTYSVTVTNGSNGTVTSNKASAAEGDTVTLTATPSEGYTLATIFVEDADGATVTTTGSNGTFTFSMPKKDVEVRARFKKSDTYIVIYEDGTDGERIAMPVDPTEYKAGDTAIVLFAVIGERAGYDFAGWKDADGNIYTDTGDDENPATITIADADVMLTAMWTGKKYPVTISDSESITITGKLGGTVTSDKERTTVEDTVTLTVTPNAGYTLDAISVKSADGVSIKTTCVTAGTTYTFAMPASEVTVTATYAPLPYVVFIKTDLDGTVVADKETGVSEGETVTLTLTPNDGYEFAAISVEDANGATVTTTPSNSNGTFTFAMPKSNVEVRVFFKKINYYIVTYSDGLDDCHIAVPNDLFDYQTGDTVTVMFDGIGERAGYNFAGWKDGNGNIYTDSGDDDNPVTFTMANADVTLTAQWAEKIYSVTVAPFLNMSATGGATGTVTPSKTTGIKEGETVMLSVIPNEDCKLLSLSVEDTNGATVTSSGSNGTFTFTMPASDVTVHAVFKKINYYRVTYADGTDSEAIAVPSDTTDYQAGDTVTVKFTGVGARSGYDFSGWSDGSTTYKSGGTTTFTMPSADVTLTAQWTETVAVTKPAPDAVGDVVLSDGTAVAKAQTSRMSRAQKAMAVAVIFYVGDENGVLGKNILGVGLQNTRYDSDKNYWAKTSTAGYRTSIEQTICTPSTWGCDDAALKATFTGDTDGSGNWGAFKNKVSDAETSENYPAWKWLNAYGKTYVPEGVYQYGWYMPSVAELAVLARELSAVNTALGRAGGEKLALGTRWYWSSSQSDFEMQVWAINFGDNYLDAINKDQFNICSCAVRSFAGYLGTIAPKGLKNVGDIMLTDGSAVPYTSDLTLTTEQKNAAVAVIFYGGDRNDTLGARTLGVGLQNSWGETTTGMHWARYTILRLPTAPYWEFNKAEGHDTNITAIQCTPSEWGWDRDRAATATFTGDIDGSDNWSALKKAVSDTGTSGNYPAWEWANSYATKQNLTGTYASGWYMPSIAELCILHRARHTVNAALSATGGTELRGQYWSSSQSASYNDRAFYVYFGSDGSYSLIHDGKSVSCGVCCIRAF